jgi:hypothetical protein
MVRCTIKYVFDRVCEIIIGTGFIWLNTGDTEGYCVYGNEPSVSVKGGECIDLLCDYSLINNK